MSKTKQCRDCFKYKPLQEIRPSSTSADGNLKATVVILFG